MDHIQRGNPSRLQVSGPLAPYAEDWRAELAVRGYSRHTVLAHAQLMAHLSGWMADAGIGVGALTDSMISGYLEARHAEGYRTRGRQPCPAAAPGLPA
jgi:integrase/recombinase XerD